MKRIIILLIGLMGVAYGQFSPTSAKTRFVNGVAIGTRDSSAYGANDSLVVVINRQGRMMYRSTDGYWKVLGNSSDSSAILSQVVRTFGTQTVNGEKTFKSQIVGEANALFRKGATDTIMNIGADQFITGGSTNDGNISVNGANSLHLSTNSQKRITIDEVGNVKINGGGFTVGNTFGLGSDSLFAGVGTFSGVARYDINRSASYTARSFTDKGYVDSSASFLKPISDTFFTTGYTTRARTKQQIDSLGALKQNIAFANVKDYGAKGDSTTDDLAAINAAISAAVVNGTYWVVFPNGKYLVSGTINVPSFVKITGQSIRRPIIFGNFSGTLLSLNGEGIKVDGLLLDQSGALAGSTGRSGNAIDIIGTPTVNTSWTQLESVEAISNNKALNIDASTSPQRGDIAVINSAFFHSGASDTGVVIKNTRYVALFNTSLFSTGSSTGCRLFSDTNSPFLKVISNVITGEVVINGESSSFANTNFGKSVTINSDNNTFSGGATTGNFVINGDSSIVEVALKGTATITDNGAGNAFYSRTAKTQSLQLNGALTGATSGSFQSLSLTGAISGGTTATFSSLGTFRRLLANPYNSVIPTGAIADYNLGVSAGLYGLFTGVATSGVAWMQAGRTDNSTTYTLSLNPNGGSVTFGGAISAANGVTAQRGNFTSLVLNKDSVPITTTNVMGLTIDTTNGRVQREPTSGSYTPTITGITNVDASTSNVCFWSKAGRMVTVTGYLEVDPMAGSTPTEFRITLPVTTTLTGGNAGKVAGTMAGLDGAAVGSITADIAGNRASFRYTSSASGSNMGLSFTFSYLLE